MDRGRTEQQGGPGEVVEAHAVFDRGKRPSLRRRRSALWGASIWGTEGPEFKSRQPDRNNPVYLTALDHD